jgi:MFS family permease
MSSVITPEGPTVAAIPDVLASAADDSGPPLHINNPLKVVIASSFVLRLAGASTAIMLAAYLRQVVNAQTDLIGILSALFYVTELTLAPVFGALSDLRGRRFILILGPAVGVIALPIYPISALASISIMGVFILAAARLLEGISTAAKVPSALGYLADATSGDSPRRTALRGRVMGFYEISFLVGLVGGTVMGGALWDTFKSTGFFLISFFYLVAALMLFFFVPESLPAEARKNNELSKMTAADAAHPVRAMLRSRLRSYSVLLKEPALRSFVPAWLAINAVVGLMGNLVQPIMIKPREGTPSQFPDQLLDGKFTTSEVGFVFAGFGLIFMLGIFVWSLLYGRIRKTTVMLAAIGGLFLTCVALFGVNNQWLPAPAGPWALVPLLVVGIFLVSGFTPVALAYLAEISGARVEHRGAVMGLYSVFLGLGQLIGSGGGGFFIKWLGQGFNGLVIGTVLLGIIGFVAVFWLRTKHRV